MAVSARRTESLAETVSSIEGEGRRCAPVAQNLRDPANAAAGVEEAAAKLGGLEILVNNAGYEEVKRSLDVDAALWDTIVDPNLKGAFFAAQGAARIMAAAGGGAIVNLCSLTSYVGVPTAVPYGASKSGLLGMTRALAVEWAQAGIRVNAIAPGYFRTAMTETFYEDEEWQKRMLGRIPQRRFGRSGDLGGVCVFLCSDAAAYVTGQCVAVDGGFLASI